MYPAGPGQPAEQSSAHVNCKRLAGQLVLVPGRRKRAGLQTLSRTPQLPCVCLPAGSSPKECSRGPSGVLLHLPHDRILQVRVRGWLAQGSGEETAGRQASQAIRLLVSHSNQPATIIDWCCWSTSSNWTSHLPRASASMLYSQSLEQPTLQARELTASASASASAEACVA